MRRGWGGHILFLVEYPVPEWSLVKGQCIFVEWIIRWLYKILYAVESEILLLHEPRVRKSVQINLCSAIHARLIFIPRMFKCGQIFIAGVPNLGDLMPKDLRVCVCVCVCVSAQSCSTLCDPMGCCPPGSLVHVIFKARILEWLAISFSRGSSWARDQTWVSWSWCNNIINKVHNKCSVHESPWNHFSHLPGRWKNCLSGNQALGPESLGAAVYSKDSMMMIM